MPLPSGAFQRRPRRPRPAVWNSAMQTSSLPTGGGAASKWRFVESSSVNTSSFASRAATSGVERRAQGVRVEQIEAARQAGSRRPAPPRRRAPSRRACATCFQIAARVTPNARASSSPECVRPSAKACNKRSTVTRVY